MGENFVTMCQKSWTVLMKPKSTAKLDLFASWTRNIQKMYACILKGWTKITQKMYACIWNDPCWKTRVQSYIVFFFSPPSLNKKRQNKRIPQWINIMIQSQGKEYNDMGGVFCLFFLRVISVLQFLLSLLFAFFLTVCFVNTKC